jgi:alkaline phosphatase
MKYIFVLVWLCLTYIHTNAQFSTLNAHSHNDYNQDIPFWNAYYNHFGSIEADIWAVKGKLYVSHELANIASDKTLDELYILPIVKLFHQNNGNAWKNKTEFFQLVIDIKSSCEPTLSLLICKLSKYKNVFDRSVNPNAIKIVITGNIPLPSEYDKYPSFIFFDGNPRNNYTSQQIKRVAMFSVDLNKYTSWNGKGNIITSEHRALQQLVDSVHNLGNKIRFWDAPDVINAWKTLINLGVDYINTDHIGKVAEYLNSRTKSEYIAQEKHDAYTPSYLNNDSFTKLKNVILLIGDGTGLAQQYAGFTANGGALTIFNLRNIGFSKTWSADEYITDSAAGGSALATGKKTQNRHIGVDSLHHPNPNIPEIISKWGFASGIVTTDEAVGATPASFYAHRSERDSSEEIASDLLSSPINLMIGGNPKPFINRYDKKNILEELQKKNYSIIHDLRLLSDFKDGKAIVLDDRISYSENDGRGELLSFATKNAIRLLSQTQNGFFLMVEGAQIDFGGHANSVPYVVKELLDFDKAVAEAIKFADENGETLVIVTADHETGGLSLLDGNFTKGMVDGQFSSNDHTGIMVPVFAYGPNSGLFRGVYENTDIFKNIIHLFEKYK